MDFLIPQNDLRIKLNQILDNDFQEVNSDRFELATEFK